MFHRLCSASVACLVRDGRGYMFSTRCCARDGGSASPAASGSALT